MCLTVLCGTFPRLPGDTSARWATGAPLPRPGTVGPAWARERRRALPACVRELRNALIRLVRCVPCLLWSGLFPGKPQSRPNGWLGAGAGTAPPPQPSTGAVTEPLPLLLQQPGTPKRRKEWEDRKTILPAAPKPTRKPAFSPACPVRDSPWRAWKSVFLPNPRTGVRLCKLPQETLCFLSKNTKKKASAWHTHLH